MVGTTKVRATVGRKVVRQADKFFTNDTGDMLDETVQNARRAGAGAISFALRAEPDGSTTMVVEDDGAGLARDRAPVLLTFGGSDNDERVEREEDAAGIGFFSLSAHDVLVESRDWAMEVPRLAFVGGADATLGDALPGAPARGLRLTVRGIQATPDFAELATGALILEATRHSGLVATLSGTGSDGVHQPRDFLDEVGPDVISTLTRSGLGVTVRVVRRADREGSLWVNFFGKSVGMPGTVLGDLAGEEVATFVGEGASRRVSGVRTSVRVLVDVTDARVLRLQLPHRNDVVRDAGYEAVRAFVLETVARLYAGEGEVVRPDLAGLNGLQVGHPLRSLAGRLGLAIAAPSVAVHAVDGGERGVPTAVTVGHDAIETVAGVRLSGAGIVATEDASYVRSLLAQSTGEAELPGVPLWDEHDLSKALARRAHSRVAGVVLEARVGDDEYETERTEGPATYPSRVHAVVVDGDLADLVGTCVDGLALRFAIDGAGGARDVRLPVRALHFCDDGYDTSEPVVIVTREARQAEVVEAMLLGFDWYSDDHESNSREDQEEYARGTYGAVVAAALGREDENFLGEVESALDDVAWRFCAVGTDVSLSVRIVREEGQAPRIVVERVAAPVAEAA